MANSTPCAELISLVSDFKKKHSKIIVAEIGVDIGATTTEVISLLSETDEFFLFDFEDVLSKFLANTERFPRSPQIHAIGNTRRIYDSYAWNLGKIAMKTKTLTGSHALFDVVYLDGAHSFLFDSAACAILKLLLKPGGFILFDDMNWTISDSPTCNPSVNPSVLQKFTKEQIDIANVSMLVELLMRTDADFKEITPHGTEKSLFQKNLDFNNDIMNNNCDRKILFDGKEISIDTLKDVVYKYYPDRIAHKKAIDSALFHLQRYLMAIKYISNFGMNTGKVFEAGGKGIFTFFMTYLLEIKEIIHVDHDLRKPLNCNMDNSCDSIICMEVFEHIKDLGDQHDFCFDGVMNALKTFWKILKPNGLMLLTTPNICGTLSLSNILRQKNALMYPKHNREYTITELYRIFNSVGFKIEMLKTEYVFRPHIAHDMLKIFAAHGYSTDYRGDDIVAVLRKPESGTFLNSNIPDIILETNR